VNIAFEKDEKVDAKTDAKLIATAVKEVA